MITIASNVVGRRVPHEFFGLSTDEKPVDVYDGMKITNASVFYEMDTKKIFMYDEENKVWHEQ